MTNGNGDCFEVAVELMWNVFGEECDALLVHAMVTHPGTGRRHPHAWVEWAGSAIDMSNGLCVVMPVELYRRLAQHGKLIEYNRHEMAENLVESDHYGDWDLRRST
jgi:hypothetical protein